MDSLTLVDGWRMTSGSECVDDEIGDGGWILTR